MNYRTIAIIGFIAVAVAMRYAGYHFVDGKLGLVCETCHQGFRLATYPTTPLPDLSKVAAQTDKVLLVNGYRISTDPDSEQFREKLMGR